MYTYLDLLTQVYHSGESHHDRTGVGTRSTCGLQLRHPMRVGFPLLTTKKMPFRLIAEELFWFLSGSTNNNDLRERGVTIWDEWADESGELGHIYGGCWRNFLQLPDDETGLYPPSELPAGNDQIAALMDDLRTNPGSRRHVVTAWHPVEARKTKVPGCHTFFMLKYWESDHSLTLHFVMRSADIFLGVPFNIASYALLLELICHQVGMSPRELIVTFHDLHLYSNHVEQAKLQMGRQPLSLPRLVIEPAEKRNALEEYKFEDLKLVGYESHPAIAADVAV